MSKATLMHEIVSLGFAVDRVITPKARSRAPYRGLAPSGWPLHRPQGRGSARVRLDDAGLATLPVQIPIPPVKRQDMVITGPPAQLQVELLNAPTPAPPAGGRPRTCSCPRPLSRAGPSRPPWRAWSPTHARTDGYRLVRAHALLRRVPGRSGASPLPSASAAVAPRRRRTRRPVHSESLRVGF